MGAPVEDADEPVDERHEQEQGDERGGESGAHEHGDVEDRVEAVAGRERLPSGKDEDEGDGQLIELDLEVEPEEFAPGEMPAAHEVAGDEQEAVDTDLAAPAPEFEKDLVAADVAVVVESLDAAVDHVVVGNDHEHQDNPEEFDVALALLDGGGHGLDGETGYQR